jgi:dTDP-L-rhamnose 4-epimerase
VYGPRQSLSNPYTGVAAIFASRLLAKTPPLIFEDGRQTRDFIHVRDVVNACLESLWNDDVGDVAVNIGTGNPIEIAELARILKKELDGPDPEILNTYRHGDIRHCYPDITAAKQVLGWEPRISIEEGIADLVEWVASQSGHAEGVDKALDELRQKGLIKTKK